MVSRMNNNYIPKHAKFNDLSKLDIDEFNELNEELESDLEEKIDDNIDNKIINDFDEKNNLVLKEENNLETKTVNIEVGKKTSLTLNELNDTMDVSQLTKEISDNDFYNSKEKKYITKQKKSKKITKILAVLLLVVFIGTFTVSFSKILDWGKDNKETKTIIDNIQNDIEVMDIKDDETTELVNVEEDKTSDYWYYTKFSLIDVDINKLKEKNSETVGWINVNNTNINYPYVQTDNNSFYLDHSYDKTYNDAGWVFLDYRNSSNLDNKNTILYAHSRLDKTMFGSLSKTLKSNWYTNKDNHIIKISTEIENSLWQIFSVYKIEEESYYITTNFSSDLEYQKFLDTIKTRSIHNFNTNLGVNDKILTLSTCYSDNIRTVVHAKLIKKSIK